jgi:hypothetical protein
VRRLAKRLRYPSACRQDPQQQHHADDGTRQGKTKGAHDELSDELEGDDHEQSTGHMNLLARERTPRAPARAALRSRSPARYREAVNRREKIR